jgi:hypothetical protein
LGKVHENVSFVETMGKDKKAPQSSAAPPVQESKEPVADKRKKRTKDLV